ncbi:hypothetical protein ABPG75_012131 [Micractinium tetrahymenae]
MRHALTEQAMCAAAQRNLQQWVNGNYVCLYGLGNPEVVCRTTLTKRDADAHQGRCVRHRANAQQGPPQPSTEIAEAAAAAREWQQRAPALAAALRQRVFEAEGKQYVSMLQSAVPLVVQDSPPNSDLAAVSCTTQRQLRLVLPTSAQTASGERIKPRRIDVMANIERAPQLAQLVHLEELQGRRHEQAAQAAQLLADEQRPRLHRLLAEAVLRLQAWERRQGLGSSGGSSSSSSSSSDADAEEEEEEDEQEEQEEEEVVKRQTAHYSDRVKALHLLGRMVERLSMQKECDENKHRDRNPLDEVFRAILVGAAS